MSLDYNYKLFCSGTGNEIIRDNMDALATRVDNWTTADARRFLMLTIPPTVRGGRRFGHHTIERQLVDTNPMLLYAAIMGGGSAIPSGVSSMGSYEVCTVNWVYFDVKNLHVLIINNFGYVTTYMYNITMYSLITFRCFNF